jgi:hypothetical protein
MRDGSSAAKVRVYRILSKPAPVSSVNGQVRQRITIVESMLLGGPGA